MTAQELLQGARRAAASMSESFLELGRWLHEIMGSHSVWRLFKPGADATYAPVVGRGTKNGRDWLTLGLPGGFQTTVLAEQVEPYKGGIPPGHGTKTAACLIESFSTAGALIRVWANRGERNARTGVWKCRRLRWLN